MSRAARAAKWTGAALLLVLCAGVAAPYLSADRFGKNIRASLQRALGRRVDFGDVRFSLFKGPGFQISNVVIHDDPALGIEPIARVAAMEVTPSLWMLLRGRLSAASIRLDDPHINLAKSGRPAEPGRWNFEGLLRPGQVDTFPGIHIRNGRINFKFGDTKSSFYLMAADLDVSPPGRGGNWSIACEAQPARTDRPAQGLGSFTASGSWSAAPDPGHLDLDVRLERSGLGEITALLRGEDAGVHGNVSARLHLTGPLRDIRIAGRMNIEDVHRWDLLPPKGDGWPLDVRGRLDLVAQQLELESNSAGNVELPLFARFRVTDYLSLPRWGISVNWNRFPAEPLLELARHMGAQLPPKLKVTGAIQGAIAYTGQGSFQGQMGFQNTVLTVPDSAPVRFESAELLFGNGHAYLKPAQVRVTDTDQAQVEADYAIDAGTLDLRITTDGMDVASLRSQVALAAVPWLEQLRTGQWRGQLHFRKGSAGETGWTGRLTLADASLPVPGVAGLLRLKTARVQIDQARVVLDRMQGSLDKLSWRGEYRYEPQAARPHRVRLQTVEFDAADLERHFSPTLDRRANLIARALGRAPVPDWLKSRGVEGTLQADAVVIGGARLENVRTHLLWDSTRIELNGIQARLEEGSITGKLAVNLRGSRPAYKFTGRARGLAWQGGKVDAEGTLDAAGRGAQLLASLTSEGTFSAAGLEIGPAEPLRTATGSYQLSWARTAPRLRFTDLEFATAEETYTGRGETQDDGRLLLILSNGSRELRVTGALAKLKLEESARP